MIASLDQSLSYEGSDSDSEVLDHFPHNFDFADSSIKDNCGSLYRDFTLANKWKS